MRSDTVLAFWNHEGAYATASQTWVDWNEEIIKSLVEDMSTSEVSFRTQIETIFNVLNRSTQEGLAGFPRSLGGTDFFL